MYIYCSNRQPGWLCTFSTRAVISALRAKALTSSYLGWYIPRIRTVAPKTVPNRTTKDHHWPHSSAPEFEFIVSFFAVSYKSTPRLGGTPQKKKGADSRPFTRMQMKNFLFYEPRSAREAAG